MAISTSSKQKFAILFLISITKLCYYRGSAQYIPAETVAEAMSCFSDKFYAGCNDQYRLTQSGNLNVPPEATDIFCNGPCLAETQQLLNCINNILSNFQFYNKATIKDVRYALKGGCSNSIQRGNFNVASYMEGETSSANRSPVPFNLPVILFISWSCSLIMKLLKVVYHFKI